MKLLFFFITFFSLYAHIIDLKKGWNLKGTEKDINVSIFKNKDVVSVWTYDTNNKKWKTYLPNLDINLSKYNIDNLEKINKYNGFWIDVKNDVGINTVILDKNDTFYWQLQGNLRFDIPAKIYDIDLFDNTKEHIKKLKNEGKIVICYINAGAYENWREDALEFPESVKGNSLDGWEGEKWLDIRDEKVRDIMKKRLDLAKNKGCDGIEPDNINGYENNTGFNLTYGDQLEYNIFLSNEAKKRGLLIVLKNDLDQAHELVNYYDFLLAEEGIEFNESDKFLPFINNNKPVYDVEYNEIYYNCSKAKNFHLLFLPKELNGSFVKSCDYGNF
jgi:hypothetical protein